LSHPNLTEIAGVLARLDALRHTPAGIPIVRFGLAHTSTQCEAGLERQVDCVVDVVAVEREALLVSAVTLGTSLKVKGFLDRKSMRSQHLELHATLIEFAN